MLNSYKFTILAILILGFIIFGLVKEYPQRVKIVKELRDLEAKVTDFKRRNEEIERQAQYFKSDAFLEKEARLKLNLRKPGEELVIIEKNEEDEENSSVEEKDDSFAGKIKLFFSEISDFVGF